MYIWNKFRKWLAYGIATGALVIGISCAAQAAHADDPGQTPTVPIVCPESPNPQPDLDWILGCVRSTAAPATATPTN